MSGFLMVCFLMVGTIAIAIAKAKTGPFKIRPSKSLGFKCFWILNVSGFRMVGFQVPTVQDIGSPIHKATNTNYYIST